MPFPVLKTFYVYSLYLGLKLQKGSVFKPRSQRRATKHQIEITVARWVSLLQKMTLRARETPPPRAPACTRMRLRTNRGTPRTPPPRLQIPACLESSEWRHAMHAGTRSTVLIQKRPRTSPDVRRARERSRNRSSLKLNLSLESLAWLW